MQVPASYLARVLPLAKLGLSLGPHVQLVALELGNPEAGLRALEHLVSDSLRAAVPRRRAEFAAGRHAAELALAELGCHATVLRAANGAPLWPAGFVGSISHGGALAVAAVAGIATHRSLGIDVEDCVNAETRAELAARVLSPAERALLAGALPLASEEARFSLGFSAKESLYKCLHPLSGAFFEFADARITRANLAGDGSGELELTLQRSLPGGFAPGYTASGPFALDAARVATAILVSS